MSEDEQKKSATGGSAESSSSCSTTLGKNAGPAAPISAMPSTPSTPASGSLFDLLQPRVNFEEIIFKEKVGHGSYGVVYKAIWGERFVAVKEFEANSDQQAIETEVKQLSRVSHDNIITLFGTSTHQQAKYLIMEYAEGGSLHNFLHGKVKPYYSTAHGISWARQCAEGVAYLHAMKPKPLIHRDLKPLNLLLTNKGRHLKICDFGTVADKSTLMTNNKGSAAWMAPEVFEGSKYTEKCDVFSWAIVLWEVLSRQRPFKETDNNYAIMWKIHKGERPPVIKDCPENIANLMTSCWAKVPDLRPSMQNVVAVMNELAACFTGAGEPLKYEFVNQQIIRTDGHDDTLDNYTLDFSNLNSSNSGDGVRSSQLTPTNAGIYSNASSDATPTNSTGAATVLNTGANVPTATISASHRWDVITEGSESPAINSAETEGKDPFNLTPSAATVERYSTIQNGVKKMGGMLMAPLAVEVDPGAWNLPGDDGAHIFSKSDGKERLTVTDAKPMTSNHNHSRSILPTMAGSLSDEEDDEEIDGTVMLDPELQPEPPIADNAQSQQIYREHQRLAKEYLLVDTKLSYAQVFKENLLGEMDPDERQEKQELLKKMSEKEELRDLYNNLKQQLEKIRGEQAENTSNPAATAAPPSELVADGGWVMIPSHQNT